MVYYRNAKHPAKYDPLEQKQTHVPDVPEMEPRKYLLLTGLGWFFWIIFCIMVSLAISKWWGLL